MTSRMIDPKAINKLLTQNVDENAVHFALLTAHGTLVGMDEGPCMPTQRSFAALVGLSWRRHVAEIEGRGSPSVDIQHVKTLRLTHKPGESRQLKGMIVVWQGIVGAVEQVKKDVLLVAQRPLNEFLGEQDAIGKRLAGLAFDMEITRDEDGAYEGDGVIQESGDVPKIRILELRAQGMAEAIAEEWPGPLPEGFY